MTRICSWLTFWPWITSLSNITICSWFIWPFSINLAINAITVSSLSPMLFWLSTTSFNTSITALLFKSPCSINLWIKSMISFWLSKLTPCLARIKFNTFNTSFCCSLFTFKLSRICCNFATVCINWSTV